MSAGRKLNRRDFLKMSGAGLAGAALLGATGCGGGSGSGNLIFSMGPDDDQGTMAALIKKFNEQSDFNVVHRVMPSDTGSYFDKLRTQLQAGSGGVDVIGGDVIWPAQLAANGWILDLTDKFPESEQKKFLGGPLRSVTYDGKVWGVPWYTDAGMLYHRADLLEKSGFSEPPKTWDELKEMADKVKKDQGIKYGFVFQGEAYEGGVCNGLEYIWTHGGDVLDENNNIVIDSPEAAAGLETYASMLSSGAAPEAVANWTETESEASFYNEDSVFIRIWPSLYGGLGVSEVTKLEPDQVGIAAIPTDKPGNQSYSTLGGWQMSINANTDLDDDAWTFIEFMTSEQSQKTRTIINGGDPSRLAVYDDPEAQEATPVITLAETVLFKNGKSRPVTEYYGDMSLEMAEQFNAALKGDISPEQAVKTLQKSLGQIMEEIQ